MALLTINIEPGVLATITDPNGLTGYGWAKENTNDITQYHYYPSGWVNIDAANEVVTFTFDSTKNFTDADDFRDWVEKNHSVTNATYAVCVTKSMDWSDLSSSKGIALKAEFEQEPRPRQIDPMLLIASEDPDKRDGSGWAESMTGFVREHFFAPDGWVGVAATGETSKFTGLSDKSSWSFSDFENYVNNEYSSTVLANGYYIWSDVTVTSW